MSGCVEGMGWALLLIFLFLAIVTWAVRNEVEPELQEAALGCAFAFAVTALILLGALLGWRLL